MHTVRNRKGARPGNATPAKPPVPSAGKRAPGSVAPEKASGHVGQALITAKIPIQGKAGKPPFLLGHPAAPTFPADLILPPHRGAIITTAAWPAGMIPAPLPAAPPLRAPLVMPRVPTTNPQGQPDRDPGRQDQPRKAPHRDVPPRPGTRTARKAQRRAMIEAELARRAVAAVPAAAPDVPEPAALPGRQPPLPASVQWVAPDDRSPLPRHRAPALPRRGLLDALTASLGDAGRMLARILPGSKRSRELRERVTRAEARLRAMEAQLAALEALRERVRA